MKYFQVPLTYDNEAAINGNSIFIGGEIMTENEIPLADAAKFPFLIERNDIKNVHKSFDVRFSSDEEMSLSDLPSFNVRKSIASELSKKIPLKKGTPGNSEENIRALKHVYYGAITTYFHLLDRNNKVAIQAILDNALFMFSDMVSQDFHNKTCRRVSSILKKWFSSYTITKGDPLTATALVIFLETGKED
ncbi:MAG: hypothetical protein IJH61_09305 [Eubacteriaceae bacterium]|nr:hypothetical protein [Eubacteriaceae bacterium]